MLEQFGNGRCGVRSKSFPLPLFSHMHTHLLRLMCEYLLMNSPTYTHTPSLSQNGHVNLQADPSHVHTSHTVTHTASRSNRGFTKKLQDMMKQRSVMEGRGGDKGKDGGRKEKSELRNWKQLTDRQLSKLTPIERSRYMAVSYSTKYFFWFGLE